MECAREEVGRVYRRRRPHTSPFYQLVERFYGQFEAVHQERYQARYGFWPPAMAVAVEKFLECGDLQQGFARVRCPDCAEELLVAFSCRGRCFCPSCHQKRALQTAQWVSQEVCAPVAHRQFVFTLPKRLRIYFRFDRRLLGQLCRAAWEVMRTVFQAVSGRPDAVPGMIRAIQTFGDLIHWHPHISRARDEGVFLPDGSFMALPKLATEPFL